MKTLEQIADQYKSRTLDGRDIQRLCAFVPADMLARFDMEVKDGQTHEAIPFTREAVIEQLRADVAFGFEKAINKRGISASMMADVVKMWNWILEEGLESFDEYPQYGLPIFKATAIKYGFPNPIGDDSGNESRYWAD